MLRAASTERRNLAAWVALVGLGVFAVMAWPLFQGRIYTADDLWAFHLPLRAFYADCLQRGERFDWMPQLFGGFFLTGEGQLGGYHPLHYLLYRFLPLPIAFDLELLLVYPFLGGGMYVFLRRHMAREAAVFGGLVFAFCGFNLLHFMHPNATAVVAHLPWLLWLTEGYCRGSAARTPALRRTASPIFPGIGIALLTGSQLLLGYPQYVWFSLLAEASFALLLAWRRGRAGWLGPLALWKLAGLLVGAVQFLPTWEFSRQAQRQLAGAGMSDGALHPLNLLQLVAPYLFADRVVGGNTHELGLYFGAAPLLLVGWLLWRRRELGRKRWLAHAALGCALLAVILALGEAGLLYKVQTWLPLVGKFRLPARYIVLFHLGLSVAAALALADLLKWAKRAAAARSMPRWLDWRLAGTGAAALAGMVHVGFALSGAEEHLASWPLAVVGPVLVALAAWTVTASVSGGRWALWLLPLFTAADLGAYGLSYAVLPGTFTWEEALATLPEMPREGRVATDLREPGDRAPRYGNQGVLRGWNQIDGYAGLEPANRLDYRHEASRAVAAVKHVLDTPGNRRALHGVGGPEKIAPSLLEPLPFVRLVSRAVVSSRPSADLAHINVRTTALVEAPLNLPAGEQGQAELVASGPTWMSIRVQAPSEQLLVVAERFHPGWEARIDGRPANLLRVNGDFQGCLAPAGVHTFEFRFAPLSVRAGGWISAVTLAGLGLLGAAAWLFPHRFSATRQSISPGQLSSVSNRP